MCAEYTRATRPVFDVGTVIAGYEILDLVGQGGYGDVYKVRDTRNNKFYALKTEYKDAAKKALTHELDILKKLKSTSFPSVYDNGQDELVEYCVMDLLGISLGTYRREYMVIPMSASLLIPVARITLSLIKEFHTSGMVHRDIKPSNFLFRMDPAHPISMIDFGLAKQFVNPDTGRPYPQKEARFTGTKKYASVNAHLGMALSWRDDLYSWFYSMVELGKKRLPWSNVASKEDVGSMKLHTKIDDICYGLPKEFVSIYQYLTTLDYDDMPDYDGIDSMLKRADSQEQYNWPAFFDMLHNKRESISRLNPSSEIAVDGTHTKNADATKDITKKEESDNPLSEKSCCLLL